MFTIIRTSKLRDLREQLKEARHDANIARVQKVFAVAERDAVMKLVPKRDRFGRFAGKQPQNITAI